MLHLGPRVCTFNTGFQVFFLDCQTLHNELMFLKCGCNDFKPKSNLNNGLGAGKESGLVYQTTKLYSLKGPCKGIKEARLP